MGKHPRSFNDLSAPPNDWDISERFDSESECKKEKAHLRTEAPIRLKFAREHLDRDPNGNILAVSEAWQLAECVASDDSPLKDTKNTPLLKGLLTKNDPARSERVQR
jgi:hypothetical protein